MGCLIPYIWDMWQWTENELGLLRKYDILSNDYTSVPEEAKDAETIKDILLLEAKLIIMDKKVIAYLGNVPEGIYSFNEAQKKEDYYIKQGKLFTFHPVNFGNMKKYVEYLNV